MKTTRPLTPGEEKMMAPRKPCDCEGCRREREQSKELRLNPPSPPKKREPVLTDGVISHDLNTSDKY